ncbi:MAG: hypothetical protein AB7L92_08065 [Alphaproteobacteria bacterium]
MKNNKNNNVPNLRERDDTARLKRIARKMIGHIEQAIEAYDVTKIAEAQPRNDWMAGGRNSLVGTLIALTDLLIKLEASGSGEQPTGKEVELECLPLSKPDKELLKQFIKKQQQMREASQDQNENA